MNSIYNMAHLKKQIINNEDYYSLKSRNEILEIENSRLKNQVREIEALLNKCLLAPEIKSYFIHNNKIIYIEIDTIISNKLMYHQFIEIIDSLNNAVPNICDIFIANGLRLSEYYLHEYKTNINSHNWVACLFMRGYGPEDLKRREKYILCQF